MAGTIATYQGFRCVACTYRCSRGFNSDVSEVTILVPQGLNNLEVVKPTSGQVLLVGDRTIPSTEGIRTGRAAPVAVPSRLEPSGTLFMAEAQGSTVWQVVVHPLWVLDVEEEKRGEDGSSRVRVKLGDVRRHWRSRGFVRRWSYNRPRGDGSLAADSLKPDRGTYHLGEVALDVVKALPLRPELARVPGRWGDLKGHVEFSPMAPAWQALGELVKVGRCVEPCLRLDGSVAFHDPGEGSLGYAVDGIGENTQPLPAHDLASLDGTGQGSRVEQPYPPDYVVVVGGVTIRTEALDNWVPVLVLPDDGPAGPTAGPPRRVVVLNDQALGRLTNGLVNMEKLSYLVLQPSAFQTIPGLPEWVADLLKEQAWRLWRMPDAVKLSETADEIDEVGPNAHLLPLLPRAEEEAGRRMPVTVETYRYATQRLASYKAGALLTQVRQAAATKSAIKEKVRKESLQAVKQNPFDTPIWALALNQPIPTSLLLQDVLLPAGIDLAEVDRLLSQLRRLDEVRKAGFGEDAAAYEQAMTDEARAQDGIDGGTRSETLSVAKKAKQLEDTLRERSTARGDAGVGGQLVNAFTDFVRFRPYNDLREVFNDPASENARQAFAESLAEDFRSIVAKGEAARGRVATGGTQGSQGLVPDDPIVFMRNRPNRTRDPRASVYSEELGIVQTGSLPGYVVNAKAAISATLARQGRLFEVGAGLDISVPAADSSAFFVPGPVRVLFGATRRPRTDRSLVSAVTVGRGESTASVLGTEGDAQTYFHAAFKRGADDEGTPISVPLSLVPQGEGQVVSRPDLVELVPLTQTGNRAVLESDAIKAAQAVFSRPVRVATQRATVNRPLPVNCDGVVDSVEIAMKPGGIGFLTTILTGGEATRDPNPFRTRSRPPRMVRKGDDADREGITK